MCEANNFNFTIFTPQFNGPWHPISPDVIIDIGSLLIVDHNQIIFPMIPTFLFFEENLFYYDVTAKDNLLALKRCQVIYDTLDHVESQSVGKTKIGQNFRWSDHTPCLS